MRWFFSFSLIMLVSLVQSQTKDNISFMVEGTCYEVLTDISKQMGNDSLVVSYFKKNYLIVDSFKSQILDREPPEIIKYFSIPHNKKIYCYRKDFYYNNVLIAK